MGSIKELKFDDKNFNKHTELGMSLLEKSLKENGAGRSILIDKDNNIIAGNGIIEAAGQAGFDKVKIVETTGDEIVAVKRTDISLDSEQGRRMAFADNATASADLEWDEEMLRDEFDDDYLKKWGVDIPTLPIDEIVEMASLGSVNEFDDDTNYDTDKFIREEINQSILDKIQKGVEAGKIRPEIENILRKRAEQCTIFNFDQIIKFYRSGDASEEELELLRRLYLVFLTPKEVVENEIAKFDRLTAELYDDSLTIKNSLGIDDEED